MADLHHRHSHPGERDEISLRLFEHRDGKNRWPRGKVEHTCRCRHDNPLAGGLDRSAGAADMRSRDRTLNQVRQQSVSKLGLEPGGLRRHDPTGIGNRHQILNVHWIQRKRDGRGPERTRDSSSALAPGASNEVDALVGTDIADPQQRASTASCSRVTSRRSAGVAVTCGSPRTMVCHRPSRNIATSPRRTGETGPSVIVNRCS